MKIVIKISILICFCKSQIPTLTMQRQHIVFKRNKINVQTLVGSPTVSPNARKETHNPNIFIIFLFRSFYLSTNLANISEKFEPAQLEFIFRRITNSDFFQKKILKKSIVNKNTVSQRSQASFLVAVAFSNYETGEKVNRRRQTQSGKSNKLQNSTGRQLNSLCCRFGCPLNTV